MNRKYFLLAALCAAMNVASGFAQDTSGKIQLHWPAATSSLWVDDQADHSMKTDYGFDGDETTRWSAGWEKTDNDANYPQGRYWYRACFGDKSVDFNVIRVKWYDNSVKTFQILTSDDYDNDFKGSTPLLRAASTLVGRSTTSASSTARHSAYRPRSSTPTTTRASVSTR